VNNRVVAFQNTDTFQISNLDSLTWSTSGGADEYKISAAGRTLATGIAGATEKVSAPNLLFFNIANVTLDMGANDPRGEGHDTVVIVGDALIAPGLTSFTVATGEGNDQFVISSSTYALPIRGGAITFDGGLGSDRITAVAISRSATPS
jgi:hypothetical protein